MQISFIMGVYNADPQQLEAAVESVLKQTYRNFEFVICDDGSTDNSFSLLCSLQKKDDRIVLLQNKSNQGLAFTLNRCIGEAHGQLLVRQDADDTSMPERLEIILQTAKKYPQYDILSSNLILFNSKGDWGKMNYPEMPQPKDFLFCVPFMHGAVALNKQAVLNAGGYRVAKETRRAEDIDLFMRMYANGSRGYTIQQRLYRYREDKNAHTKRKYRFKIDETKVKIKGFRSLGLLPAGFPYAVKPLLVGLLPMRLLNRLKDIYYKRKSG